MEYVGNMLSLYSLSALRGERKIEGFKQENCGNGRDIHFVRTFSILIIDFCLTLSRGCRVGIYTSKPARIG